jgi:hypothetical protein
VSFAGGDLPPAPPAAGEATTPRPTRDPWPEPWGATRPGPAAGGWAVLAPLPPVRPADQPPGTTGRQHNRSRTQTAERPRPHTSRPGLELPRRSTAAPARPWERPHAGRSAAGRSGGAWFRTNNNAELLLALDHQTPRRPLHGGRQQRRLCAN